MSFAPFASNQFPSKPPPEPSQLIRHVLMKQKKRFIQEKTVLFRTPLFLPSPMINKNFAPVLYQKGCQNNSRKLHTEMFPLWWGVFEVTKSQL